jgi:hypothetical protein
MIAAAGEGKLDVRRVAGVIGGFMGVLSPSASVKGIGVIKTRYVKFICNLRKLFTLFKSFRTASVV